MVHLTITIPTYNRPDHIRKQVRDVLAQLNPCVNLIVYDNCSDIPVESLFAEEEKKQFVIIRNKTNIGGDANNAHCLENVSDGWVWLLGDDDRIRPDAVNVILALIESHPDCCYINTANKIISEVNSFQAFLDYFRIRGTYGKAFFQSACLFNMNKLRQYVFWYYDFLSSQMGQLCMVIKYMELAETPKAFFTTEELIVDKEPGGWDPMKLLINSSAIIDKFHYCKRLMRGTVFASLGNMYLDSISSLPKGRFYYLRIINKKLGFFNILRYNYIGVIYYIMTRILPEKIMRKIHDKVALFYLKKKQG